MMLSRPLLPRPSYPGQRRNDFAGLPADTRSLPLPLDIAGGSGDWLLRRGSLMGTAVCIELWCEDLRWGEAAAALVVDELVRVDRSMNPRQPASEMARINREAAQRPVALSAEMFSLLTRAIDFSRLSGGACDITCPAETSGRVGPRPPLGWQQLRLDPRSRTLRFAHPGVRIDLGTLAHGHALDQAGLLLQRRGIAHARVSVGDASVVLGQRRGAPWTLALRDVQRGGALAAELPLEDAAVATVGDCAADFVESPAVARHDPPLLPDQRGGDTAAALRGAAVLSADVMTSQALARALQALGLDSGLRLVEGHSGADAVLIDAQGALHATSGLRLDPRAPAANPSSSSGVQRAAGGATSAPRMP